jgi:hypothetical protein
MKNVAIRSEHFQINVIADTIRLQNMEWKSSKSLSWGKMGKMITDKIRVVVV